MRRIASFILIIICLSLVLTACSANESKSSSNIVLEIANDDSNMTEEELRELEPMYGETIKIGYNGDSVLRRLVLLTF